MTDLTSALGRDIPLVIAAHGTRDAEGQQVARAFIERVRSRLAPVRVEAGFVELMEPEIDEAITAVLDGREPSGDLDAVVVPLMLATGGHMQDDIPEAIDEAGEGFELRYGRALQPDPRLILLMRRRIDQALAGEGDNESWRARDTAVVLVGRGNKTTSANAEHYRLVRTVWEESGLARVEPAFIQVTRPSLPEALSSLVGAGHTRIVVAQNFLFPGLLRNWLGEQSQAWLEAHPGVELRVADVLGDSDELADVVVDRYLEQLDAEGTGEGSPGYLTGLLLQGRDVLVVGGGSVAQRRIPKLLDAGARVRVVAPNVGVRAGRLAREGAITWEQRAFRPEDVDGAWFVLAAANDPAVNEAAVAAAEAAHTFAVRADAAHLGSAYTPATEQAGGLTVAVVGNRDPQRSVRVRDEVLRALQT